MNSTWLETAGEISLYFYFALVGGCLLVLVFRATLRPVAELPGTPGGRFARILIEYFGNTGPRDQRHALPPESRDRRRNLQARFFMDYIRDEMIRGDVTSTESEELIDGLREAMRSESQGRPS
jgi:hypothetical protein